MPAKQYTTAYIAPSGQTHPFIQIFHKCILRILREGLDDIGDLGRFGTVQDRYHRLQS